MIAFSAIRARIRGLEARARMTFLAPISTNALLEAKRGTLEEEYAAVASIFDRERAVRAEDAAEMAALRQKLRRGRRRRPQRLLRG